MDKWLKLKNYLNRRKLYIWTLDWKDIKTVERGKDLEKYIDQVLNKMDEIEKEGKDG